MNRFEGSFLGNADRIDASTVLECGVCWWVYDPNRGDAIWQIPGGTPFTSLPAHWRCPHCDASREQFMVIDRVSDDRPGRDPDRPERRDSFRGQLSGAYKRAARRLVSLPVYRRDLPLGVLGPRVCDAGQLALVYTPWCMNLVLRSAESERLVEGSERRISLPNGDYPFVRGFLDGVGAIENCSLFSPMEAFENADAVKAVARAAFLELFRVDEQPAESTTQDSADTGRRRFLGLAAASS